MNMDLVIFQYFAVVVLGMAVVMGLAMIPKGTRKSLIDYFSGFNKLKKLPKAFWAVIIVVFIDSFAFFALYTQLTIFLSTEMAVSDAVAGYVFTAFSFGILFVMLISGMIQAKLGYRKMLKLGALVGGISRLVVGCAPLIFGFGSQITLIVGITFFVITGISEGLIGPFVNAGLQRFTSKSTASVGFNFWYMIMQGGAIATAVVVALIINKDGSGNVPIFIGSGVLVLGLYFVAHFMVTDEGKAVDEENGDIRQLSPEEEKQLQADIAESKEVAAVQTGIPGKEKFLVVRILTSIGVVLGGLVKVGWFFVRPILYFLLQLGNILLTILGPVGGKWLKEKAWPNVWGQFKEVAKYPGFVGMIVFLFIVSGPRMSFSFPFAVYNKYYLNVLGDAQLGGLLQGINPYIIFVGLVLATSYLVRKNSWWRMFIGMSISAGSTFILALPPQWFVSETSQLLTAYTVLVVVQIVIYAIGETIWSPVMSKYIMGFAPPGKESEFAGFATLPTFFSKTLIGLMSGHLIAAYSAQGVQEKILAGGMSYSDSPEMMNLILGCICITGVVGMALSYPWFFRKDT